MSKKNVEYETLKANAINFWKEADEAGFNALFRKPYEPKIECDARGWREYEDYCNKKFNECVDRARKEFGKTKRIKTIWENTARGLYDMPQSI